MEERKLCIFESWLQELSSDEIAVYLYIQLIYFHNQTGASLNSLREVSKFSRTHLWKILKSLEKKGFVEVVRFGKQFKVYRPLLINDVELNDVDEEE